ncbi:hypothetical protein CONPUDRAFT_81194 [Coniophora puteana RWD-64-598 SS2]|uniref:K Homology domain-containing protein n=1 Tax=Coniophora puteana (strain RWD-64-598) TaxID=741705 RepID=A0A5M3MWP1_CONPW|nr:uncharacterized protein CONPUDRAFT_81194 [Coniophora puteana RWD-64-598 SS2]EIW83125.1 hypothetical protein CONPUDRAFT_81194 [Coniophora puteana RWD-64-598 SS2]
MLSAADLQKRHQLEGAPDPFPSLEDSPVKSRPRPGPSAHATPDTNSTTAFPSLAPSPIAATTPGKATWGSDAGPRIRATVKATPSDSFTLPYTDVPPNRDGKPQTLGDVLKQVMTKFKVKIEASANQRARQTTFHMKAESQKELDKAKRGLLASLSPVIEDELPAPASTIPAIIGPKGATLKQIRDQTGVRIDIPRKEEVANGANGTASGKVTPGADDEEDEVLVPIKITGPQPLVIEARAMINEIISSRTSNITQRVRDIPAHILPFVTVRRAQFVEAAQGGTIHLALNNAEREITVSGDREAVHRVIESIKGVVEQTTSNITSLKISLPKRQHRLLVDRAAEEIMTKSKCAVQVAPADEPSDEITVWGNQTDLTNGLSAVMEKANSKYIHEFPLPGPVSLSKQLLTYMTRIGYPKTLSNGHPGVDVFTPSTAAVARASVLNIDIVGDKAAVDNVVREVSGLIGKLIGATKEVPVEYLVHRVIQGKHAKKFKQFHETHNVQLFFPAESLEQSSVLLVYDPLSPSASPSPDEKEKHLDEVAKEVLKVAKDAGEIKTEVVPVDKQWHDAVVGKDRTTLNAIIGEEQALSVRVGASASHESGENVIVVRGSASDVDNAVKKILAVVDDAKNDAIISSYSTEFDIDREYVGRIVGAQGAGINKLRDVLGVKVDVNDDFDEKDKEFSKKKRTAHQKSKIKITGRKENVEEAKKRILAQVERLADETSEILHIPARYHASLIGQSGKYAIRLEEKYAVKITFPRSSGENGEGRTREQLKADEVLIKGGKKGVAHAKAELLDALEFEKDNNNVLEFDVPTHTVARILGRGGASINEIKDDTDAQIDVDRVEGNDSTRHIVVRGTKKGINAAKSAIMAIVDSVGEETTVSMNIEQRFHRTIIGAGGQGLKDIIARCGGPDDSKVQAGLVRFPRQGEPSDEVRLRGEPKLVNKIKAELEKVVTELKDRVVLAVEIPASQHRTLIGRGGQHLNDLQNRTSVQVQFPGSRSYNQVSDPENMDELVDASPANIVKVSGSRAACENAIAELKSQVKAPPPESITAVVSVPLKYHHAISQQGGFFRTLRSYGVQVDQSAMPQKSAVPTAPPQSGSSEARIDDDDSEVPANITWQVGPNYQDAEEGDSQWTLKARDDGALERAQVAIQEAIQQAENMTHVGFLTLPDRSAFPRIVGAKGANVMRLRNETGADITVSRESSDIIIIGSETAVEAAKDAILKQASSRAGRR